MSAGGAIDSSVTLDEVFTVLAAKRVPLAPELAGYLVLEIAEHADPAGGNVDPRSVFVGEEGTVALVKPKRDSVSGDAETSVREVLARLLDVSGSVTPALAAASRRKSGAGLPALAEELETALIPVNRAAGRRALARLARECRRVMLGVGRNALPSSHEIAQAPRRAASIPASPAAPQPASARRPSFASDEDPTTTRRPIPDELIQKVTPADWTELPTSQFEAAAGRAPSPSQADVDALIEQFGVSAGGEQHHARALKAMAGLDATPPPPRQAAGPRPGAAAPHPTSNGAEGDIDALLDQSLSRPPPPLAPPPASSASPPAGVAPARRPAASSGLPALFDSDGERQLPTQPSQVKKMRASLPSAPAVGRRATRWIVPVLGLAVVAGGVYAVGQLRLSVLGRPQPESPRPVPAPAPSAAAPSACKGALVVSNVPPHAEVLVREGQAPVDVEKMPVGARLEFVATAEGYAPKRVVVPQGAVWDRGPEGKPRYEAAVQLDRARGSSDSWPAGEPGSEVGGQGPPGTVRVVATPRGAEIWMLAGIGPDARVDQIPCDRDWDVLVAGPTTFRKRLHVTPADFKPEDPGGVRVARTSPR